MKSAVISWDPVEGIWSGAKDVPSLKPKSSLLLYFGDRVVLSSSTAAVDALRAEFPDALIAGCSTSGEICGGEVHEGSIVAIAMSFDSTTVDHTIVDLADAGTIQAAGERLATSLAKEDLCGLFVISDGTLVDGDGLLRGIEQALPAGVTICGGLAADGDRFQSTLVGLKSSVYPGKVVGIGFYGDDLEILCGSGAGWECFGPLRRITKSKNNVLMELDGEPALGVYTRYLGDQANLPADALHFPLEIYPRGEGEQGLVRTILAVDDDAQTITFAGNIPEGSMARLMRAGSERLLEGAQTAAERAMGESGQNFDAAILISCVGRRIILGLRTEDEVGEVRDVIGTNVPAAGFYSYGELGPFFPGGVSELHNQTMTVTLFRERQRG
jgi:hypothetical protein